jgi:hypothetical protein
MTPKAPIKHSRKDPKEIEKFFMQIGLGSERERSDLNKKYLPDEGKFTEKKYMTILTSDTNIQHG